MRPSILFPLFAPVTRLGGVGPKIGALIAKAAGEKVVDLLWHLPVGIVDRRHAPPVGEAKPGEIATLTVKVLKHEPSPVRQRPYRIVCGDDTGFITLIFFSAKGELRAAVVAGGLLALGGFRSFAEGGWAGTPLSDAPWLPQRG